MELRFHKRFDKEFQKLSPKIQHKAKLVIQEFQRNPRHPLLRNHALRGSLEGLRAVSVTGDVRIIFTADGNYQKVTLLRIGTHSQVY